MSELDLTGALRYILVDPGRPPRLGAFGSTWAIVVWRFYTNQLLLRHVSSRWLSGFAGALSQVCRRFAIHDGTTPTSVFICSWFLFRVKKQTFPTKDYNMFSRWPTGCSHDFNKLSRTLRIKRTNFSLRYKWQRREWARNILDSTTLFICITEGAKTLLLPRGTPS